MKYPNGANADNPIWATVTPISAQTPIGAACITQFVTLNMTSETALRKSIMILPCSPIAAVPNPKKTLKKITGIMSPVLSALKKLVGIIPTSVAQIPLCALAVLAVETYWLIFSKNQQSL